MQEATKQQRIELFANRCRERGLPLTPQRRAVLEAALELDHHPTADQILEHVVERLPDISRATVYRTLDTLVAMGVLAKLSHSGRAVRFDSRIDQHHHLICVVCDSVIDLDDDQVPSIKLPDTSALGFAVEDYCLHLRGLCAECRSKEETR